MVEKVEKIVWVSRHELTEENKRILDKAFGEWEVAEWVKDTVTAEDIRVLTEKHRDAKFVVVLPPNLLMELLKTGVEVFRFIVEREVKEDGEAIFTPVGLEKIEEIKIVTERVV